MSELSIVRSSRDREAPFPDTAFVHDLRLDDLIRLGGERVGAREPDLASFLTRDPDTVRLRAEMFRELLDSPGLFDALQDSFAHLADMYALQHARDGALSEEQLLYSIRELEEYLAYLGDIRDIFTSRTVKSALLLGLWEAVRPLAEGEDYERLCAAVKKQSHAVKQIKSITVGVNLDATLRPVEAGVMAVNEQSYVSGEPISHLLRLHFKKDDFTCMAPLYPTARKLTPQEQAAMADTVHMALRKIFGDSLKSWASLIKSHVLGNLGMLSSVAEEWRFVRAAMEALRGLRRAGVPLCIPTVTEAGEETVMGLCHPLLALHTDNPSALVRNDLHMDGKGSLYILTGPNSGGKSVYLQAVGLAYALLHLGLPLPAEQATVRMTDGIFTHFADIRDGSYRNGRLGTECEHIHALNRHLTENSLILFDEALSGTNATEATAISGELLAAYAELGVRGIWVTHFHDLCRLPETVGETRSRLANLSARVDTASHDRLFCIVRGDGEAKSYAMDIAERFRLTRREIVGEAKGSRRLP